MHFIDCAHKRWWWLVGGGDISLFSMTCQTGSSVSAETPRAVFQASLCQIVPSAADVTSLRLHSSLISLDVFCFLSGHLLIPASCVPPVRHCPSAPPQSPPLTRLSAHSCSSQLSYVTMAPRSLNFHKINLTFLSLAPQANFSKLSEGLKWCSRQTATDSAAPFLFLCALLQRASMSCTVPASYIRQLSNDTTCLLMSYEIFNTCH